MNIFYRKVRFFYFWKRYVPQFDHIQHQHLRKHHIAHLESKVFYTPPIQYGPLSQHCRIHQLNNQQFILPFINQALEKPNKQQIQQQKSKPREGIIKNYNCQKIKNCQFYGREFGKYILPITNSNYMSAIAMATWVAQNRNGKGAAIYTNGHKWNLILIDGLRLQKTKFYKSRSQSQLIYQDQMMCQVIIGLIRYGLLNYTEGQKNLKQVYRLIDDQLFMQQDQQSVKLLQGKHKKHKWMPKFINNLLFK